MKQYKMALCMYTSIRYSHPLLKHSCCLATASSTMYFSASLPRGLLDDLHKKLPDFEFSTLSYLLLRMCSSNVLHCEPTLNEMGSS